MSFGLLSYRTKISLREVEADIMETALAIRFKLSELLSLTI
jgi:hypothetical protein